VNNSLFLQNQHNLSFWVAVPNAGEAESSGNGCDHEYSDIQCAETSALLHTDSFGDRPRLCLGGWGETYCPVACRE
jgi:hypothetical protein